MKANSKSTQYVKTVSLPSSRLSLLGESANKNPQDQGFSLVELMVVVSILAAIISLAMPKFALFHIKAARAEMHMNFNALYTMAHSHHAENGVYPAVGVWGVAEMDSGMTIINMCNAPENLGFQITNCQKLRYLYTLDGNGGAGNGTDLSRQTYFTLSANAYHRIYEDGDFEHVGASPPTRMCRPINPGMTLYFNDYWTMYEDRSVKLGFDDIESDALKSCF